MHTFAAYTHELVPFASGRVLTGVAWVATATEAILGIVLLTGRWPRLVGAATCLVLTIFGITMAISLGVASPLGYSVFSAASAAAAYAVLGTTSPSPTSGETLQSMRFPKGSS
jgi:hypothetical protein